MMESVLAKLYVDGILEASKLSRAAKSLGVRLEPVLEAIERAGIPRSQVYLEATSTPKLSASRPAWSTYTLEEAVEVLYNRAVPAKELARKLNKTEKSVNNFRWRAFRQGFLVPKKLWEAILAEDRKTVESYGWRGEFATMLYNLVSYAERRKLTPPKVVLVEET
ncbi:hypothetical protein P74p55 [Thermus phage P74-26]|uniref:Uncharacterized protein n=1 Tax=Thermus phage P74-26 TaxID=2914007 RepID=A7XXM6_BP742|nr:hypothetical protein P74p55 [Thermus phage P74-26]ABU97005.1 hypothetical protein P74p55 [Thermus phage P74-26]